MSEINIEIAEALALRLIPKQTTIKMLRNGKVGEVTVDSVKALMRRSIAIGFNPMGEAYKMNLALWIRHDRGTDYFETVRDEVDELALSLGVDLPH